MENTRKNKLQKTREELEKLIKDNPFLQNEATEKFIAQFTDDVINNYKKPLNNGIAEYAKKRAALKFRGMDEDTFKTQLKEEYNKQMELFNLAKTITDEEAEELNAVIQRAKEKRMSNRTIAV